MDGVFSLIDSIVAALRMLLEHLDTVAMRFSWHARRLEQLEEQVEQLQQQVRQLSEQHARRSRTPRRR